MPRSRSEAVTPAPPSRGLLPACSSAPCHGMQSRRIVSRTRVMSADGPGAGPQDSGPRRSKKRAAALLIGLLAGTVALSILARGPVNLLEVGSGDRGTAGVSNPRGDKGAGLLILALLLVPGAILAVVVGLTFHTPALWLGGGVILILVVPALC